MGMGINLNLDNFETDPSRTCTPYVVTSPRSLRACANLGVDPCELVYRTLEEYEESLRYLPLSEIYRIYEENETGRQELLLKCRAERDLLIKQEKIGISSAMAVTQFEEEEESDSSSSEEEEEEDETLASVSVSVHHRKSTSDKERRKDKKKQEERVRHVSAPSASSLKKNQRFRSTSPGEREKRIHFKEQQDKPTTRRSGSGSRSSLRVQKSQKILPQSSDTESTEQLLIPSSYEDNNNNPSPLQESRSRSVLSTAISVPDLSGRSTTTSCYIHNLDFRKVANSPRSQCYCGWESSLDKDNKDALQGYFRKYDDILDSPDLSLEDRKIMECLIMKKGKQMEWEKKAQEVRKAIEQDRLRRWNESQMMTHSWQERLAEKRRFENLENTRRYLDIQAKSEASRKNLMQYLEERDRKVKRYLDDINYNKRKMLLEKQKREALRQIEVGRAIEKLMEEDRQHRDIMKEKLQRRMEEAEIRKRRREQSYLRHVAEMNRLEEAKRSLKLESLEQKSRESIEEMRNQIEEKEHKARLNYINRLRQRDRALSEGGGLRQKSLEKAKVVHEELVKGLEDWHRKVLELQTEAQRRAELRYNQEIHRKRIRAASDRILREERSSEMIRRLQEMEVERRDLLKTVITQKDSKTARVKADKDRKVQISRIRAQHAAELRQELRSRLHPETFDRKAARAELEGRLLKRCCNSSYSLRFNPRVLSGGGYRHTRCLSSMNNLGNSISSRKNSNNGNGKSARKASSSVTATSRNTSKGGGPVI